MKCLLHYFGEKGSLFDIIDLKYFKDLTVYISIDDINIDFNTTFQQKLSAFCLSIQTSSRTAFSRISCCMLITWVAWWFFLYARTTTTTAAAAFCCPYQVMLRRWHSPFTIRFNTRRRTSLLVTGLSLLSPRASLLSSSLSFKVTSNTTTHGNIKHSTMDSPSKQTVNTTSWTSLLSTIQEQNWHQQQQQHQQQRVTMAVDASGNPSIDSNIDDAKNDNVMISQLSPFCTLYHIPSPSIVESTQTELRRLLHERYVDTATDAAAAASVDVTNGIIHPSIAVIADQQSHGRGTQGRTWESQPSDLDNNGEGYNLFLSVAIPMKYIPVTLTLLPLYVGVIVAERVQAILHACNDRNTTTTIPQVNVKWPNDVLINNDAKISGTLIESEIIHGDVWFLIGIGVNVAYVPNIAATPGKHGRLPTCIQHYCTENRPLPSNTATVLGTSIATDVTNWVYTNNNPSSLTTLSNRRAELETMILNKWKSLAVFGGTYELRGSVVDEDTGLYEGTKVTILDISPDGQLMVRVNDNGNEPIRYLIADYMF
jgi:biotin-(acetyl-CoA carboxylase) ligase